MSPILALELVAEEDVVATQAQLALVVLGSLQEGAHLEKGQKRELKVE